MAVSALRWLTAPFVGVCVIAICPSCTSRPKDEAAPVAVKTAPEVVDAAPPVDPTKSCAIDADCIPLNCCFALEPTSCIPRARAHCDAVQVQCGAPPGVRYDCACADRTCVGKLAAGGEANMDAGSPPEGEKWAVGDLKQSVVLSVIMQHARDVKACRAQAKKGVGVVALSFDVGPSGAVSSSKVAASTVPNPKLAPCIAKKASAWRFPKAKGPTHVMYSFQFSN
jgi:hypothetical protein